jgi:hypothetical protein
MLINDEAANFWDVTMTKKKKLTAARKRARKQAKAERQRKYRWVLMNGKQVRVKRQPTVDGMPVDDFILQNADPIWLHQHEMWEYIETEKEPDPEC